MNEDLAARTSLALGGVGAWALCLPLKGGCGCCAQGFETFESCFKSLAGRNLLPYSVEDTGEVVRTHSSTLPLALTPPKRSVTTDTPHIARAPCMCAGCASPSSGARTNVPCRLPGATGLQGRYSSILCI